ncbi:MAG: hypothetical protein J5982_01720 [Bacilli bacterium]|nr:hypothetical protein [Bacilli bacterium]
MINKAAKTYNEIIIKKKCYDLLKYIYLTDDELNKIYDFLLKDKNNNKIIVTQNSLFYNDGKNNILSLPIVPKNGSFDKLEVSCLIFTIVPHYEPHSGGGFSSGGGSSNNNNNNNNNNN